MKRLPLAELHRACTLALPLYLHLLELAVRTGRLAVVTDRVSLAAVFKAKRDTVTQALGTLKSAELLTWRVRAKVGKDGRKVGKFYVISLHKAPIKGFTAIANLPHKAPQKGFTAETVPDTKHPKRGSPFCKKGGGAGPLPLPVPPQQLLPTDEAVRRAFGA